MASGSQLVNRAVAVGQVEACFGTRQAGSLPHGKLRVLMGANKTGWMLPLYDFQQMMLQWNEYQPFHVVDVVELARPIDTAKLQAAAEAELTAAGIFHPIPDLAHQSVMYMDKPVHVPVELITPPVTTDAHQALEQHCSAELNRRFRPGVDPFLRLWVLRTATTEHLGMTWQHWPCDGYAAADLLRRILGRYLGIEIHEASTLTDREPPDLAAAFRPWLGWRTRLGRFRTTIREIIRVSRAHVAPRPADPKTALATYFLDMPMEVLSRIQEHGRRNDATVNDVIAAALMNTLLSTVPERNLWRRRVSISNIVDLRQSAPEHLARKWGLFLGFCVFDCTRPAAQHDDLVSHVRAQSRRAKATKGYLASLKAMGMSRRLWPWLPGNWRWSLSRCLGSFSAVMSNLRLPPAWYPEPLNQEIKRYWRTLPLGSIVPLSVAVTTFDTRLTLTLTTESNSYCAQHIDSFKKSIMEKLM